MDEQRTGLCIRWSHRSPRGVWGRFGGGWQWKLGIQQGGNTVIVSLFVAELRIEWRMPAEASQ